MKTVCVLLNGPVRYDARVIKTVNTLSERASVDLFYIDPDPNDGSSFNGNVSLHPLPHRETLPLKLLRHSLFYYEFAYFESAARATGKRWDIIYANDLPTLLPAVRLKKKMGAHLVYDSHEIYLETLNQFFPAHANAFKRMLFYLSLAIMRGTGRLAERRMLRVVDTFITVNQSLAAYFRKLYGKQHVEVVMNCPPRQAQNSGLAVDFRKLFNWGDVDVIFIYQGVMNRGRGYEILLQAMNKVDPRIKLVMVGEGMLKQDLEHMVQQSNLRERVKFTGQAPQDQLLQYTRGADIGINFVGLERLNLSKTLASPNKLFEYMHAGIPVLVAATPENQHVLNKHDIGIAVNNNVTEIAEAIESLAHLTPAKLAHYKSKALGGADEYCWENQSQHLLRILNL